MGCAYDPEVERQDWGWRISGLSQVFQFHHVRYYGRFDILRRLGYAPQRRVRFHKVDLTRTIVANVGLKIPSLGGTHLRKFEVLDNIYFFPDDTGVGFADIEDYLSTGRQHNGILMHSLA